MKNLMDKLQHNAINYELKNYGSNYFGPDFIVKGVFIPVRNYGIIENAAENVETILKQIARLKKYTVVSSGSYGKICYTVYLTKEYNELMKYNEEVKETSEKFWNIYRTCGKAAADVYYHNACRRHNLKLVV